MKRIDFQYQVIL